MNRNGKGEVVLKPWLAALLLSIFLAGIAWAGSAGIYKERVGENTRKLERIERTLSRVEKNQVKIAAQLGVELSE